jgi:hypothetical protein
VTRRFHWIEKQKFGVTYPSALFVESVPIRPGNEKW